MNRPQVFIVKTDGTKEPFDSSKLENSLKKAGASAEVTEKICHHISKEIEDGMSTSAIYRHAFELLHKFERPVSVRYSLKRAISELGPTGFPFERYIAEIYKAKGFEVATDQIIQGKCVSHEVDVVAWNENKLIMAEAKFHNELGIKSDLKVALYVKARYDDIHGIEYNYGKRRKLDEGLLITNTNFTVKAVEYSECAGVKLIGWNYPSQGNLHDMIEDMGLHPVTCLTTLTNSEKKDLMENGITLCRNVRDSADKLMQLGLSREAIDQAVEESNFMCPPNA
jgi:hypothetical protein